MTFREEAIEDRAHEKRARPFIGLVVNQHGDLEPPRRSGALGLAHAPNDRPRVKVIP